MGSGSTSTAPTTNRNISGKGQKGGTKKRKRKAVHAHPKNNDQNWKKEQTMQRRVLPQRLNLSQIKKSQFKRLPHKEDKFYAYSQPNSHRDLEGIHDSRKSCFGGSIQVERAEKSYQGFKTPRDLNLTKAPEPKQARTSKRSKKAPLRFKTKKNLSKRKNSMPKIQQNQGFSSGLLGGAKKMFLSPPPKTYQNQKLMTQAYISGFEVSHTEEKGAAAPGGQGKYRSFSGPRRDGHPQNIALVAKKDYSKIELPPEDTKCLFSESPQAKKSEIVIIPHYGQVSQKSQSQSQTGVRRAGQTQVHGKRVRKNSNCKSLKELIGDSTASNPSRSVSRAERIKAPGGHNKTHKSKMIGRKLSDTLNLSVLLKSRKGDQTDKDPRRQQIRVWGEQRRTSAASLNNSCKGFKSMRSSQRVNDSRQKIDKNYFFYQKGSRGTTSHSQHGGAGAWGRQTADYFHREAVSRLVDRTPPESPFYARDARKPNNHIKINKEESSSVANIETRSPSRKRHPQSPQIRYRGNRGLRDHSGRHNSPKHPLFFDKTAKSTQETRANAYNSPTKMRVIISSMNTHAGKLTFRGDQEGQTCHVIERVTDFAPQTSRSKKHQNELKKLEFPQSTKQSSLQTSLNLSRGDWGLREATRGGNVLSRSKECLVGAAGGRGVRKAEPDHIKDFFSHHSHKNSKSSLNRFAGETSGGTNRSSLGAFKAGFKKAVEDASSSKRSIMSSRALRQSNLTTGSSSGQSKDPSNSTRSRGNPNLGVFSSEVRGIKSASQYNIKPLRDQKSNILLEKAKSGNGWGALTLKTTYFSGTTRQSLNKREAFKKRKFSVNTILRSNDPPEKIRNHNSTNNNNTSNTAKAKSSACNSPRSTNNSKHKSATSQKSSYMKKTFKSLLENLCKVKAEGENSSKNSGRERSLREGATLTANQGALKVEDCILKNRIILLSLRLSKLKKSLKHQREHQETLLGSKRVFVESERERCENRIQELLKEKIKIKAFYSDLLSQVEKNFPTIN